MCDNNIDNYFTVGAGAYSGCTYCCVKGEYAPALQKMVYLNHRAFLPEIDMLCRATENFPTGTFTDTPQPKTMAFVDEAIGKVVGTTSNAQKKEILQSTGCKGPYSLRRLPYHNRYLNTPVEPMHVIKGIAEHVVKLLSGIEDSLKVRREEEHRQRFRSTWVRSGCEKFHLPSAPFSLSRDEMAVANGRAMSIIVPAGVDWRRRKLFDRKSLCYVKSVEWRLVLSSGILKYCIRGLLGEQQRNTLFELCDGVSALLAYD